MATYPIPESLSDTYDGAEWAIAAILSGRVVALRYIADIAPEIAQDEAAIRRWALCKPPEVRELQALGTLSAGLISAEGFEESWQIDNQDV